MVHHQSKYLGCKSRLIDFAAAPETENNSIDNDQVDWKLVLLAKLTREYLYYTTQKKIDIANSPIVDNHQASDETKLYLQLVDTERDPRYEGGRLDQPALKIRFFQHDTYTMHSYIYEDDFLAFCCQCLL